MQKISIVTSVYKNDKPEHVRMALDSMLVGQTVRPAEVVLVQDGPVSLELGSLLSEYEEKYADLMHIVRLEKNGGLGNALRLGVSKAKYGIIARMDSDDICVPDRFEKQLHYMELHPEISILGGQIDEFIDTTDNVVGRRVVPCEDDEIKSYIKSRCPFNHMTVMFRKEEILKVGNYQDWFWNEDYYLWIRLALTGCSMTNLRDTLVKVRVGKEMYQRRGGWKYFKSEARLQKYMWNYHLISFPKYLYNIGIRFMVQVAMPNRLRGWVFRTFARKQK